MQQRCIAAAVLAIITVLAGIDLLQDAGVIHYSTKEMDRSLEDVLNNYGEAVRSAESALSRPMTSNLFACGFHDPWSQDPASGGAYVLGRNGNRDTAKSVSNRLKYIQVSLI